VYNPRYTSTLDGPPGSGPAVLYHCPFALLLTFPSVPFLAVVLCHAEWPQTLRECAILVVSGAPVVRPVRVHTGDRTSRCRPIIVSLLVSGVWLGGFVLAGLPFPSAGQDCHWFAEEAAGQLGC